MLERVKSRLEQIAEGIHFVELDPTLARLAGDLAERHGLRAGDAVHLASALLPGDARFRARVP